MSKERRLKPRGGRTALPVVARAWDTLQAREVMRKLVYQIEGNLRLQKP